jgi:hypothetical protein
LGYGPFGPSPTYSYLPLAGGVILGCSVVLVAHIARALFDQVNAAHNLLALERERHEGD